MIRNGAAVALLATAACSFSDLTALTGAEPAECVASGCPLQLSSEVNILNGPAAAYAVGVSGVGETIVVASEAGDGAAITVAAHTLSADVGLSVIQLSEGLPGNATALQLAMSTTGLGAVAVWRQVDGENAAVFAACRGTSGVWQVPTNWGDSLSANMDAYEPAVEVWGKKGVAVVWNQWTGSNYEVALATSSLDSVGCTTFVVHDGYLSPQSYFTNNPRIALQTDGAGIVSWYQAPQVGDLMAFVVATPNVVDGFESITAKEFVSPLLGAVEAPFPVVNRAGDAAVAWSQKYAQDNVAVFAAYRKADGTWQRPSGLPRAVTAGHLAVDQLQAAFVGELRLALSWRAFAPNGAAEAWFATTELPEVSWDVARLSDLDVVVSSVSMVSLPTASTLLIGWVGSATGSEYQGHLSEVNVSALGLERITTSQVGGWRQATPAPLLLAGDANSASAAALWWGESGLSHRSVRLSNGVIEAE